MSTILRPIAALAISLVVTGPAIAQIYKCTDAGGRISYGEAPCSEGAKKSLELKSRQRAASESNPNQAAGSGDARSDSAADASTSPRQDEVSQESAAKTLQRAQLQAEAARQRLAEQRSPGQLVQCDGTGCWGAKNGVRYQFANDGKLVGTNGSTCVRVAQGQFSCD